MGRLLKLLAAACFLSGLGASVATADTRTVHLDDPLDAQPSRPSLSPRPVMPDIRSLDVGYDSDTGTISATVAFSSDRDPLPVTVVVLGCSDAPLVAVTLERDADGDVATARMGGFEGEVRTVTPSAPTSRTLTGTVAHPAFANRPWRCAEASQLADNQFEISVIDDYASGWFAGYAPSPLTPQAAQASLIQRLEQSLNGTYAAAARKVVSCPSQQVADHSDATADEYIGRHSPPPSSAICRYWLRFGHRVTTGSARVTAADGLGSPTIELSRATRYRLTTHGCSAPKLVASVRANYPCGGPRRFADDLALQAARRFPRKLPRTFSVQASGSNTAGFETFNRFRCRSSTSVIQRYGHPVRRTAVTCSSRLGERFSVVFHTA